MTRLFLWAIFISLLLSCDTTEDLPPVDIANDDLYFPPISNNNWETSTPEELDWETEKLEDLYSFLEDNGTRAFIILKDGKIITEKYWGRNILNTADFDQNSTWYWASAGKTLTAFLVGLAQQDGLLNIAKPTSDYLGKGWTSLASEKEDLITVRHQLTMTTGLDYEVDNIDCTNPECLTFKADAGTQWYYHNAPYTLLGEVVASATGMSYNQFTNNQLASKIGMKGTWRKVDFNTVYWSTARDAARFGLLILNEGKWEEEDILVDKTYYQSMVNTSQNLNPSYGYLWWLNGKESIIYPSLPDNFSISLAPNAPDDLFAALGKNGQFIDVVPSQNLVVVRIGQYPSDGLVPLTLHDQMWEKIGEILD
ncbi:MAG: serine hydrolase domain-containing protein [Bacteroidota bacterium]